MSSPFSPPTGPQSTLPHRVAAAAVTFLAAGPADAFALLLIPGLIALVWPGAASCAALGAMALGHVAWRLAEGVQWITTPQVVACALLAGLGAGMTWLSFRVPRGAEPRRPYLLLLPLAGAAALSLLALSIEGDLDVPGGEPVARTLGLYLLGIGAGLLRLERRAPRWLGAAVLAASLPALLLALGTERLRGSEPRLTWSRGTATAAASVALPRYATLVDASPSARYFALKELRGMGDREPAWTYAVADFAGFRRDFPAQAVAFLSDEQVLVLAGSGNGSELRLEPVRGGAPAWTSPVPTLFWPRLDVDGTGRWSLVGTDRRSDTGIMVTGDARGPGERFTVGREWMSAFATPVEGELLAFRRARDWRDLPMFMSVTGLRAFTRWDVGLVRAGGERRLGTFRGDHPACSGADGRRVVCQLTRKRRAMLWSISGDGRMERVGSVPPDLDGHTLRGGVLAAVRPNDDEFVLVDPGARRGTRLRFRGLEYVHGALPVPGGAMVQHSVAGATRVTVFRIAR